jgi:hypothetical protein
VSRLSTFLALAPTERRAFFAAWRWTFAARIRLRVSGLGPTLRAWHRPAKAQAPWPAAARWVRTAARYCPGANTCLVRSVALYGLLHRAGVPAEVRIGVGTVRPQLEAHAWVEVAGQPVNDAGDVAARYRPFGRSLLGTPAQS